MAAPKVDEAILKKLKRLLKKPRTISELAEECSVSVSTVYRYLKRLEAEKGHFISASLDRPTKYKILV